MYSCSTFFDTPHETRYNAAVMRLKHLELQGFKTFASKTEFVFPTGVTAIVGPNGSGKSNVADALRWALGEQVFSALRAKRTEDLIFAGGEGRPRAGMAEVYLTLDNSDGFFPVEFNEVVVGRRAYRDGENEYLLNGSKVRLRDVSELLAKTGLARRTYTVIGQGMVDQALALNSDERRALFEEAAGISLYRHKREDALKKLDETRRNLERVRDIVAEIGPRVRQLERQAQRARDYARLTTELHDMERTWYGYHWGKGQVALSEAKEAVEAQTAVLTTRRAETGSYNDRIETIRRQQFELRTQVSEWHRASSGLHTQAEALQRQLAVLEERARSLQQQIDQTQIDQSSIEAELTAQADRVTAAEAELNGIVSRYETQAAAIAAAQAELAQRQTQRKSIQQARAEAQTANQKAELALEDRRNRRAQIAQRHTAREQDVATHNAEIDAQRQKQSEIETQRTALDTTLSTLREQRTSLQQQSAALDTELDAARQLATQREAEFDEARTIENRWRERYAVLSDVRASLSGFDAGTRTVLNAHVPGVRGALATLIRVDPEWERAIEAALGSDIQSIVIESSSSTEKVRDLLGDSNGRVSLLPLDTPAPQPPVVDAPIDLPASPAGCLPFGAWLHRKEANGNPLQPIAPQLPADLKFASACLTCDDDLRPAIEALLKQVVVVETVREAEALRSQLPDGYRIATRSGEVLHSSGLITLGRAAGSGEFLAREREWRELPARIDEAERSTQQVTMQHTAARNSIDDLTQRLTAVTDQMRATEKAIGGKTEDRRAFDRLLEDAQRAIDWRQGLIVEVQAEMATLSDQDAQLQAEEDQLQADIAQRTTILQQSEAQLSELPLETLTAQLTALQAEAAVSDQLRRSQTNVVQSYRAGLTQMRSQLQSRLDRVGHITQEQGSIGTQLDELRQREATLHDEIAAFTAKIDPAEARLHELEIAQNRLESEERSARNRLSEMESFYNQAMLDMARREEELNHLRARIEEELGLVRLEMADLTGPQPLPLTPIVSELPTVESLPEGMEQELQRMKAQMRRLGPINPEAQVEYEESKQRFEFLTQQSGDLEQAIEQLHQVIGELDQLMETSFRDTFHKIAEEFKGMFQKLFGGGSAKLVLTDPENMSVTGVEVIARPPGKKQQGLALLSGGERSLTAAALMFAILKVKPPPFCILDETDAALDEANVGRFRDTIKELGQGTQFVIITHNRGTIEAADTIYGISMGTDSASRAISLELEAIQRQE
jgi:chromosome segregation protein